MSARLVIDQLLVERLELYSLVGVGSPGWLERRRLNEDEMPERSRGRLRSCVHPMANRPALHEDDGMVAILARDCRRQSRNESRLGPAHHLLEAVCRNVMTFVNDEMTVIRHAIVNDTFLDEALNHGDIEQSRWPGPTSADATD